MFDGENISFDASLVIYINSTNIPPIMIIHRIYEHQNLLSLLACFLPDRAKDLPAPLYRAVEYRSCLNISAFTQKNKTAVVKGLLFRAVFTTREALKKAVDYTDRVVVVLSTSL